MGLKKINNWLLQNPLRFYIIVLLVFIPSLITLDHYFIEDWADVLVEAHGLLFDLLLFGVLLTIYETYKKKIEDERRITNERSLKIDRYLEEIEDFRIWGSTEGMLRIAGNIRRLNKLGVTKINLFDCKIKKINLKGFNLEGSHFGGADLGNGILRGANLVSCNLIGTYLGDANLRGANIKGADLERAKCQRTNFQGANLRGSNCTRAKFWDANLQNADLRDCDLKEAAFGGTILASTRFYGAKNLTVEQLLEAKSLKSINIEEEFLKEIKKLKPELLEK
jgi:uncharacterized protein YjbI with pentapeptide repeats